VQHLAKQGFELGEVLGQGLSGSVYKARQRSLNRCVAVKFFDSAFVREDEAMRKRFARESRILAKFQHPGMPYILTEGEVSAEHGPTPYFVMEFVQGDTLRDLMQSEPCLDADTAIDIAGQVMDALRYAHERKIVHRDVKPSNILVDRHQRCFLIDFSIGVSIEGGSGLTRATESGVVLGTQPYMAPEQCSDLGAKHVDARADIYSIGVVLIEMLSGSAERTNIPRTLARHPHTLIQALEKACATQLEDRFQTAEDFMRAIGGARRSASSALMPSLAVCPNIQCSDANWSGRGYYRGPRIIEESTNIHCTSCGHRLRYRCEECAASMSKEPYCGGCGAVMFKVPLCKKCGSYLTREFIDADTSSGCQKCRPEPIAAAPQSDDFIDNVPF